MRRVARRKRPEAWATSRDKRTLQSACPAAAIPASAPVAQTPAAPVAAAPATAPADATADQGVDAAYRANAKATTELASLESGFLRDNWLSNRVFKSFEEIVDRCCEAWNKLVDQPWRIMPIGLRDWAHEF